MGIIVSEISSLKEALSEYKSLSEEEVFFLPTIYRKINKRITDYVALRSQEGGFLFEVEGMRASLKERVENLENRILYAQSFQAEFKHFSEDLFILENVFLNDMNLHEEELESLYSTCDKVTEFCVFHKFQESSDPKQSDFYHRLKACHLKISSRKENGPLIDKISEEISFLEILLFDPNISPQKRSSGFRRFLQLNKKINSLKSCKKIDDALLNRFTVFRTKVLLTGFFHEIDRFEQELLLKKRENPFCERNEIWCEYAKVEQKCFEKIHLIEEENKRLVFTRLVEIKSLIESNFSPSPNSVTDL